MSTLESMAETAYAEDISNKRKRDLEDTGDREQKKVHIEDSEVSIKDLHLNVGPKYLLCKSRKAPFLPITPLSRHSIRLFPPNIIYYSTWLTWSLNVQLILHPASLFDKTSISCTA